VGTLCYQKNQEMSVRALGRLVQMGYDASLLLAGEASEGGTAGLLQVADRVGVKERIGLLGKVKDVLSLLSESDFFWMSSRWEGLPLSLLEAMSVGLPVIATNAPGIRELVVGDTGVLVPLDDDDAMAQETVRLLGDPQRYSSIAKSARRHIEANYNSKSITQRYLDLYAHMIAIQGTHADS